MSEDAGRTLSVEVPDAVADWLAERDDPATAAATLLVAQHSVAEDPDSAIESAVASVLADRMDAIAEAVAERLDSGEPTSRTTDRASAVETADGSSASENRLETLSNRLETVESTLEGRLDDLEADLDRLAWVVVEDREGADGDPVLERIRRTAQVAGVDRAACVDCGGSVDLSLLSESRCPHCETAFEDLDTPGGWFATARLVGGPDVEAGDE